MNLDIQSKRFCTDPEGNKVVAHQLTHIIEILPQRLSNIDAIILGGSFGRGEGATSNANGAIRVLNDYDIVLITPHRPSRRDRKSLRRLRTELEHTLGIRHIDFIPMSRKELCSSPVSMMRFDIRSASHTLWGNTESTLTIPEQHNPPFPLTEILYLLINRMVTLLEGHPNTDVPLDRTEKARQVSKVWWAVTDSLLYRHHSYKTRYSEKASALYALSTPHNTHRETVQSMATWAIDAFTAAHVSDGESEQAISERWNTVRALLMTELIQVAGEMDSQSYHSIEDLYPNWRGHGTLYRLAQHAAAMVQDKTPRHRVERAMATELSTKYDINTANKLIRSWYQS